MMPAPRIALTPAQIDQVVAGFYARIRADPQLAPVFAAHVTDWPAHEAKISRFWRNALLQDRSYSGNPMRAHMQAGNIDDPQFDCWLALFDETLTAELPVDLAQAWSALAHRIGRGLRYGMLMAITPAAPPKLNLSQ